MPATVFSETTCTSTPQQSAAKNSTLLQPEEKIARVCALGLADLRLQTALATLKYRRQPLEQETKAAAFKFGDVIPSSTLGNAIMPAGDTKLLYDVQQCI